MRVRVVLSIVAMLVATSCKSAGSFVWVDELPESEVTTSTPGDYVIGVGDVLSVRVYSQDAITTRAKVREDGKISVPLVGDVQARGKRPAELAKNLEVLLKPFVVAPSVAVIVEESQGVVVSVVGEVTHAGQVSVEPGAGVVQAIAAAGGLTEFADRDSVYVFRKNPRIRVRFTWDRLTQGVGRGATFALMPGDVVVVE